MWCRAQAFVGLVWLVTAVPAIAQSIIIPGTLDLGIGEEVEVRYLDSYVPGTVAEMGPPGLVWVKLKIQGRERKELMAARHPWIRKLNDGTGATGDAKSPKQSAKSVPSALKKAKKSTPARTWSDSTGKFKVEASYVGAEGDSVKLKKTDGTVISVPKSKLSQEDQTFLNGLAETPMSFATGKAAPRTGTTPANRQVPSAAVTAEAAASEPELPAADIRRMATWATARQITITPVSGWSLTPDPGPAWPPAAVDNPALLQVATPESRASGADTFFESPERILFDSVSGKAIVVLVNDPPSGGRRIRLSRIEMKTGNLLDEITYASPSLTPVDISPAGTLMASLPDRRDDSDSRMVEISRLQGKSPRPVRRWNMGEANDWAKQFQQVRFIGEDHLLTMNFDWGGVATLWNIDKAQAVWTAPFSTSGRPALSAGGNQLAVETETGLAILNAMSGVTLAWINTEAWPSSRLSFSPDGRRLARVAPRQLEVWDLATGKRLHDLWFPKQIWGSSVDFLPGNYLLVDHQFVIDAEKRIVLWDYVPPRIGTSHVAAVAGGSLWAVGESSSGRPKVECFEIPAAAALRVGAGLEAQSLLAMQPGARVSLHVNLPGASEGDVQSATANLAKRLKANGMTIAPDAPLTLEATIADAGTETVAYSRFVFDRVGEMGSVATKVSVLSLKENGQEIWVASGSFGGSRVNCD